MASRPIFDDIEYDSFESGDTSRIPYDDAFGQVRSKRESRRLVNMRTSQYVERFIHIVDGGSAKKMDFSERPYLRRPYDTDSREIMLFTSRQTEKSTTVGNKLLALSGMKTFHTSLFVTPSAMQTKVFSTARIDDIVKISPMMKSLLQKDLTHNLLEKEFLTRSKIYLRYAFLTADRSRGLSVNTVFFDEVQDLLKEVIPVIKETASHDKDPLYVYSGTPKTFDNTIEALWSKESTQSEWCIPCEKHGTPNRPGSWHWVVLGLKNIGKKGPICERCGTALNPEHPMARWVNMNPKGHIEGFRICRLMVPWYRKPDPDKPNDPHHKWRSIITALENYPLAQFMNEVMALSYDSGVKPLTRGELIRTCDSTNTYLMEEDQVAALGQVQQLYGGIDWGTGENAYTVMVVGGYVRDDSNFQILYAKRFEGPLVEPDAQMKEIMRLINKFRLKYVGVDYGMGFHPNKKLTSVYGAKRIHAFQYAARATVKIKWKGALARYLVYRTPLMADIFNAIKNMKIRFPSWDVWKTPYGDDMLSIFAEYSETMKMIKYDKPRGIPDDTFHALCYCMIASFFDHRRPDILSPLQEPTTDEANQRIREEAAIEELDGHVSNDWALGGL